MPTLKVDIVDGADFQKTLDQKSGVIETGTKVGMVSGLAGEGDAASTLIRAQAAVEGLYPLGMPIHATHPHCTLRGYRNEGIAADSGAVMVRLMFSTPPPGEGQGGGGGSPWTVTDEMRTERVTTQLDPQSKEPLWLTWVAPITPGKPVNKISRIVTITYIQTIKRLVFSAVLTWPQVAKLEAVTPGVNAATFLGLPKGYWALQELSDVAPVGGKLAQVTVVLESRKTEDWSEYTLVQDNHSGIYYADTASAKALASKPYKFGVRAGNGILRSGPFPERDLKQAFGIDSLAQVRKVK